MEAVGEGVGGADDFDVIGVELLDTGEGGFGVHGVFKVVVADEQGCTGFGGVVAEAVEGDGAGFFGRLDLEIEEGTTGLGGGGENLELFGEGAGEIAAEGLAPAGGDGGDLFVLCEEGGDGRDTPGGVVEGVKAELKKGGVCERSLGAGD